MLSRTKLLICDLDNTLYDWVSYFVASFYAMVDATIEITGCDRETLLNDLRTVHQKYHDSERPWSLLETATVSSLFEGMSDFETKKALDHAFHAFNSTRKKTLVTYPHVYRTLDVISSMGIKIVAHTESNMYAVIDRLRRLELNKYFMRIYCRERANSAHPDGVSLETWLDDFPIEKVKELSCHQRKPDSSILKEICKFHNVLPSESVYVGDSIIRDVVMAKNAGVFAIWAAYGVQHNKEIYKKLVRITHWTDEDIQREGELAKAAQNIEPDFIAKHSVDEILKTL